MNDQVLQRVLSCKELPSLPAVAVRVVELTADPNVTMEALAETIQLDQALAAKVLQTVNSSFYGLRRKCSTIQKALVLLGLKPVKSLTLGFSLVSAMAPKEGDSFDHISYWRRGLFSGVGAKCIAESAKLGDLGDEAFLGGLLQDIGMMALYRAIPEEYLKVLESVDGDHRALVPAELEALDTQHPDIGATLAKRWKLPDELTVPIRYHERPTAAPADCSELVRCVALGNLIHDVLSVSEAGGPLGELYKLSEQWFGLGEQDVDAALLRAGEGVREMSRLFRLDTGQFADAAGVLKVANEQINKTMDEGGSSGSHGLSSLLIGGADPDPLTGCLISDGFERELSATFNAPDRTGEIVSVLHIVIDGVARVENAQGITAADDVVVGAATLLKRTFEPMGGVVGRLSNDAFGVMLPSVDRNDAAGAAETLRDAINTARNEWVGGDLVRIALGLATGSVGDDVLDEPRKLLIASERAAQAAKQAGGDCLRTFVAKKKAA